MAYAKSFRDLDGYRLTLKEAKRVFEVTKGFPQEETYDELDDAWQHAGAMLNRMIQHADSFCEQRPDGKPTP